jgi:hypothetical protein
MQLFAPLLTERHNAIVASPDRGCLPVGKPLVYAEMTHNERSAWVILPVTECRLQRPIAVGFFCVVSMGIPA